MNEYSQVNRFTEIKTEAWIIRELKWDLDFLFACVKSILIHPVDAGRLRMKYDRAKSKIFHASNTTVEEILKYEKLKRFLCERQLPLQTCPHDRAVLSCDHHALLFTSFVRYLGIPIRARTGFSKYIVNGLLIPHWVTEIYDDASGTWTLVDPERQFTSVHREDFLFAGEAWQYFEEHPTVHIPSYSGFTGKQGLKHALICDLNCIFRNELLGYEWRLKKFNKRKPDIIRISFDKLRTDQQKDIRRLAELSLEPDTNRDKLRTLYQKYIPEDEA
jgi:hypothetical protein